MPTYSELIQMIPAFQLVFKYGVELTDADFTELTPQQYEAFRRKEAPTKERIFRFQLEEPSAIERTAEKVTWEISVVTESQKKQIIEAVKYIRLSSDVIDHKKPTFKERLDFLRTRFPPEVVGDG